MFRGFAPQDFNLCNSSTDFFKCLCRATTSQTGAEMLSPFVSDDAVFAVDSKGKLSAFNRQTGDTDWSIELDRNITSGVSGDDKNLYVALRAADGRVFWEIELSGGDGRSEVEKLNDLDADVQVFEPYIYAVNYQGNVAQIDAAEGSAVWSSEVSSVAGLAVSDSLVIVTDEFDAIRAFNRADGEPVWQQEALANRRLTGPVAVESEVVQAVRFYAMTQSTYRDEPAGLPQLMLRNKELLSFAILQGARSERQGNAEYST